MASAAEHHEYRSHQRIEGSSDRSFGLVFAGFFALLSAWSIYKGGKMWSVHLGIAITFSGVAVLAPGVLAPANRLWTWLGLLLAKIVNPLVMGIVFFVVFTPAALFLRARGKDLLGLKIDRATESYWVTRDPPGPLPGSMKEQF